MNPLEELRHSFRPSRITALFVGESGPRSGKFFYTQNTGLFRAMRSAFHSNEDFLSEFKSNGFYLDDLSLIPVNGMDTNERKRQCEESVVPFADRLGQYKPAALVIPVRRIDQWVREAVQRAGLTLPIHNTTYPGRFHKHREQFANEMAIITPQLLELRQGSKS